MTGGSWAITCVAEQPDPGMLFFSTLNAGGSFPPLMWTWQSSTPTVVIQWGCTKVDKCSPFFVTNDATVDSTDFKRRVTLHKWKQESRKSELYKVLPSICRRMVYWWKEVIKTVITQTPLHRYKYVPHLTLFSISLQFHRRYHRQWRRNGRKHNWSTTLQSGTTRSQASPQSGTTKKMRGRNKPPAASPEVLLVYMRCCYLQAVSEHRHSGWHRIHSISMNFRLSIRKFSIFVDHWGGERQKWKKKNQPGNGHPLWLV